MGAGADPDVLAAAPPARPRRRVRRRRAVRVRPELPLLRRASPARTSTSRRSRSACWSRSGSTSTGRGRTTRRSSAPLLAIVVRDQGDDVHHGVRDGLVLPVLVRRRRRGASSSSARSSARAGRAGAGSWPPSPGVFTLLFTTFLTHPDGLWDGLYTGLKYWLDQHGVARGGEPWQFYPTVLITIEWPALLLGAIGAVSLWRRKQLLRRVPDLGLRRLADRLLVGGREVRLAGPAPAAAARPARRRRPAGDLAGARDAGATSASRPRRSRCSTSASASWWVNVDRGADPREMLVSTQSATDVKKVADQVQALADSRGPGAPPLTVTIDSSQGATFPYAWYFRHLARRLHRPLAAERRAADVRRDRDDRRGPGRACRTRSQATTAASSSSASGGCATTARSRPRQPFSLHHAAQGLEPHGRDEGMALRQEGPLRSQTVVPWPSRPCGRAGPTWPTPASP